MSKVIMRGEFIELDATDELKESLAYNDDLAPVRSDKRCWGRWDKATLWISLAGSVPTFSLGSLLTVYFGLNSLEAILVILISASLFSLILLASAFPGVKYGVPSSILFRSSFGIVGSRIPSLFRLVISCCWFGVQCLMGATAFSLMTVRYMPSLNHQFGKLQVLGFFLLWLMSVVAVLRRMAFLRVLKSVLSIMLLMAGIFLIFSGLGDVELERFRMERVKSWSALMAPILSVMGMWSLMALNVPDYTRFTHSFKEGRFGLMTGFPLSIILFSSLGILINPFALLAKLHSVGLLIVLLSVFSMNVVNNLLVSANDLENIFSKSFNRIGAVLLAAHFGLLLMSWELVKKWEFVRSDLNIEFYFTHWLFSSSKFVGIILGIVLVDFFIIKNQKIDLLDIYRFDGKYPDYHRPGIYSLIISSLIMVIGLDSGSWLMGLMMGGVFYYLFDIISWQNFVVKDFILE